MATDESGEDYQDNGERAIFFARGVLETVKKLRWVPDVIHCQGWMAGVIPFYVKTAYHDEPSFANTKVVTSLFTNELQKDLGNDMKKCLAFKDSIAKHLEKYNEVFDFYELGKMAIDYSDGIIVAKEDVNATLLDYTKAAQKPMLPYQGEGYAQAYHNFYENL